MRPKALMTDLEMHTRMTRAAHRMWEDVKTDVVYWTKERIAQTWPDGYDVTRLPQYRMSEAVEALCIGYRPRTRGLAFESA